MTKVTPLHPARDPDIVLEKAIGQYSDVLIIGWDKNDKLKFDANELGRGDILELIALFKHKLLDGDYDG